jgi:hypothetical protein
VNEDHAAIVITTLTVENAQTEENCSQPESVVAHAFRLR